ncbi:MAG: hydrogenase formation protein HypD [Sediminibacterium sp.]|jgi:hydrogenase expression/formation protein HypD|nr:hydrogenase formation protein HypD [Methanobrevibacter sp.]MBR2649798.1 hydrogenase formation protein HypD [Sediminibacterium sp.]MCA6441530.1 hydrogenase formation protein HypD [Chitinophagaceae bacterium]
MKYVTEYRDADIVHSYLACIKSIVTKPWTIMEVCGGQTHSLVKHGLLDILPPEITIVHGPGCPVCVTPQSLINQAVSLSIDHKVILCSFGDMLRVPGSKMSLLEAKARGADVRILYSPLEAVEIAKKFPDKQVVFFAVGFETTAPANALSVLHAYRAGLKNYSILTAHVLVPPAIRAIMDDPHTRVNGFLAAGHVCTIMGNSEYYPIAEEYKIPLVVTGFEPVDLMQGLYLTIQQLEEGKFEVINQYSRVVKEEGNPEARAVINKVFEVSHRNWRGIGVIPRSGYALREEFALYDAEKKFGFLSQDQENVNGCIAGSILKGLKKPKDCPHFNKTCTPLNPLGAPMVSTEGACAAYYHFSGIIE